MSSDDLSELGAAAPPINILEQQRQLRSQGPENIIFHFRTDLIRHVNKLFVRVLKVV